MTDYYKDLERTNEGSTHWEGCYNHHAECAKDRIRELSEKCYRMQQALMPFAIAGMDMRNRNQSDKICDGVGPYGSSLIVRDFVDAANALYGKGTEKSNIQSVRIDDGTEPVCGC